MSTEMSKAMIFRRPEAAHKLEGQDDPAFLWLGS